MKRSGPPRRLTPLRAKTELRSKSRLKGTSRLSRRRTVLQRSAIAKAKRRAADPVVAAVFERDGGCVLRTRTDVAGECFGSPTPHHLLKQSQGGRWAVHNLVTLCSHHNGTWVEGNPDKAWGLGLVVRRGETTAHAWQAMRAAGLAVAS